MLAACELVLTKSKNSAEQRIAVLRVLRLEVIMEIFISWLTRFAGVFARRHAARNLREASRSAI